MYLYFISALVVGLILSTNLSAEITQKPTDSPSEKMLPKQSEHFQHLKSIQQHNAIFDDYSSGGIPYESYKK